MNKTIKSSTPRLRLNIWAKAALIVAAVFALIIGLYAVVNANYDQQITQMKNAINESAQSRLAPMGGVKKWGPTVVHGANILDKMTCIDTNCPQVEAYWYVPVGSDQESNIKSEVEKEIIQHDANLKAYLTVDQVDEKNQLSMPEDGKKWIGLRIIVTN